MSRKGLFWAMMLGALLWVLLTLVYYTISPHNARADGFSFGGTGLANGSPAAVTLSSQIATSISKYSNQIIYEGWTADVYFLNYSAVGAGTMTCGSGDGNVCVDSNYPLWNSQTGIPNFANPAMTVTLKSPGYDRTGAATTVTRTLQSTAPLRAPYSSAIASVNNPTPVFSTSAGLGIGAYALSDVAYVSDVPLSASFAANAFSSSPPITLAGSAVTNSSLKAYPPPICSFVTPPGERLAANAPETVEVFCAHIYGRNGAPVAAVKITASDGTHSTTKTATLQASTKQLSASCTATTGSNVLTNCTSIQGFRANERVNVAGIPGQPVIGAIDTTVTTNCPTGSPPCLELFVAESATFNTNGSLGLTAPTAGFAWADGGFAGQTVTETDASAFWTVATQTIVAPSVKCPGACTNGTAATLPTPASGQWMVGQFLYDAAATPCIPTDTGTNTSEYFVTNTSTLAISSLGNCAGHTLSGLAVAATPGSPATNPAAVSVSTSAPSATSGSGTVQFNHNFKGASGAVTVTAGPPVPVYSATFSKADLSAATFSNGAIYFRAIAYPWVGDQVWDSQTPIAAGNFLTAVTAPSASATTFTVNNCGGVHVNSLGVDLEYGLNVNAFDVTTDLPLGTVTSCSGTTLTLSGNASNAGAIGDTIAVGANVRCDWQYFYNGGIGQYNSCSSTNAVWFPTNGQAVSPNPHNLWAYYDGSNTYPNIYAWVSSSAGGSTAVQATSADPGSAAYYGTIQTALTALAAYNNANNSHNDTNGGIVCLVNGNSYTALTAAITMTSWKPGLTFTGANTGSACPNPNQYQYAATPAAVVNNTTAFAINGAAQTRAQNLTFQAVTNVTGLWQGHESTTTLAAFPTSFIVFDSVTSTGATAGNNVLRYSAYYVYNSSINDATAVSSILVPFSSGAPAVIMGSTEICGNYGNATENWVPFAEFGNTAWNCALAADGVATEAGLTRAWPLSPLAAFNKFMGISPTSGGHIPDVVPGGITGQNLAQIQDVVEQMDAKSSSNPYRFSADNNMIRLHNAMAVFDSLPGARTNFVYNDGGNFTTLGGVAGGALAAQAWNVQQGYSLTSGIAGTVYPAVTMIDPAVNGNNYTAVTVTLNQAVQAIIPCTFELLNTFWIQAGAITNSATLADVGAFTATSSGTTLTTSAISVGSLLPNSTIATAAGAVVLDATTNCAGATACPVRIVSCATTCSTASGNYTLTAAPAVALNGNYVAQATNLLSCQVVKLVQVDPVAASAVPVASDTVPGRTALKDLVKLAYNHEVLPASKGDAQNAASFPNGARVGEWPVRFGTFSRGRVYVTTPYAAAGSTGGALLCFGYGGYCGDTTGVNVFFHNDANTKQYSNMSAVRFAVGDDRSDGGADANYPSALAYPGLGIGSGDYAAAPSVTLVAAAPVAPNATAVQTVPTTNSTAAIWANMGVIDLTSGAYMGNVLTFSNNVLTLQAPGSMTTVPAGDTIAFSALYGKVEPGAAMYPWDVNGVPRSGSYDTGGAYTQGSW